MTLLEPRPSATNIVKRSVGPVHWIIVATLLITGCAPSPQSHSDYPTRQIAVIVPSAVGEDADLVMRALAQSLAKELGQTVSVENLVGGGGSAASDRVRQASPDGYTLLALDENTIMNQRTGLVSYGALDFEPIALLVTSPGFVVSAANTQWKGINELIEDAKRRPNAIRWGMLSSSANAAFAFSIMSKTGAIFRPISYDSPSQLVPALVNGEIDVAGTSNLQGLVGNPNVTVLGRAWDQRASRLPQALTLREQGVDTLFGISHGLVAPKGTPSEITKKVELALQKVLATADLRTRLEADNGVVVTFLAADKYTAELKAKDDQLSGLIKQSGFKICPIWPFCK